VPLAEPNKKALIARLNRIEGQVRGIRRMIEEPRRCIEILQQLAAAEAALNRVSLGIIRYHAEVCVPSAIQSNNGDGPRNLSELVDIFDRFSS
jgi:DNA-binding FrmR family transcriptional regulator